MSTFWITVVLLVLVLELVRIGLSGYILIHVLESPLLLRGNERPGQAARGRRGAGARAHREALLPQTLDALRAAMDEARSGQPGPGSAAAIAALDRYILHLQDERG